MAGDVGATPIFQTTIMDNNKQKDWDSFFMHMAKEYASRSKCYSRQLGALIVNPETQTILSAGYNSPPKGYPTLDKVDLGAGLNCRECPRKALGHKSGEATHICPCSHAERNAIYNSASNGVKTQGMSIYTYSPLPCQDCTGGIINCGIKRVVYLDEIYDDMSVKMFGYTDIELVPFDKNDVYTPAIIKLGGKENLG